MKIQLPPKILWKRAQSKATDLYINRQITKKLYKLIMEADYTNEKYIAFLTSLTEDCMRIKGYYRNDVRKEACDHVIDIALAEFNKEV